MEELQISEGFKRSSKGEEQTSPYGTMGWKNSICISNKVDLEKMV
jgi:hypothetical protein